MPHTLFRRRIRVGGITVMATDSQPSLEYMQWYYSCGKPYLFGGQSIVIPPHMQRHGGSATAAQHDPNPMAYYSPEPPEPQQEPQPDPEQSGFVGSDSYHPDLSGTDNLPSFSGPEYAYDFELFGSYSPGPYPQHYGTPSGASSLSLPNEGPAQNDFLPIFTTPPPAPNDNVGRRGHPERDHRPPNRYTPRTTPSNHQF